MFRLYKSSNYFAYTLLSALAVVLLFSSWGNKVYRATLRDLAGSSAFAPAITSHQILVNGQRLSYKAIAGYLTITDKQDRPSAHIFYTSYSLDTDRPNRPVTFVFNGGPGSASIWLHMGSIGPVRSVPGKQGYQYNSENWLSFTDLVFIDPVGTGYSKPADGVEAKQFYSYQNDISSIAAFIKLYLQQRNLQTNRVFLVGESYGAARAVGLAAYLQDSPAIKVSGLTLISPALNYRLVSFHKGNDKPYPLYLPAFARAAQYHHRLADELEQLSADQLESRVTHFAQGLYTRYLAEGDRANPDFKRNVIDSLSYYTGLTKDEIAATDGRVSDVEFTQSILKSSGNKIGTFNSTVKGQISAADPSEAALLAVFPGAFKEYIKGELQYDNNLPYLATTAVSDWNYGPQATGGYFDVSKVLEHLMTKNPDLKVSVAAGYYDLATPLETTRYVVAHLNLVPQLRHNISMNEYRSGHMVYTSNEANAQFHSNSEKFYQDVLKKGGQS
jgi:carboxypeptidase C (cathepsin A)